MQFLLTVLIVLLAAIYLAWVWWPKRRVQPPVELEGWRGCTTCGSCSSCAT
jgi:hypothetical protein